jgi:hypothetical protein
MWVKHALLILVCYELSRLDGKYGKRAASGNNTPSGAYSNHPTIFLTMTSTSLPTASNVKDSTLTFIGRDPIYNYNYSQPGELSSWPHPTLPSITRYDSKYLRCL